MLVFLHLLMSNISFAEDLDGDSVDSSIDCDDSDSTVGAGETYYADNDGDGFGDGSDNGFSTCVDISIIGGWVTNNEDCDDSNPNAYPGVATNDSITDCMVDNDGDGFGDSDVSSISCFSIEIFDLSHSGDLVSVTTSTTSYDYSSGTGIYAVHDVCFDSTSISFQTSATLSQTEAYVSVSDLATGMELGYSNSASDNFLTIVSPTAGTDCDDSDTSSLSTMYDADCDGYLAHVDCDPYDADFNLDCSGQGTDPNDVDNDGDGFTENQGDCNDGNSSISPNAEEVSDGVDNDCDGQIDENTSSNTAPTVDSLLISPQLVYTNETLVATATASDVDGDTVALTYDWYVDGTLVQSGTDNTLDGASFFDKDNQVYVRVTANDGTEDGIPLDSVGVTVSNSMPVISAVTINPSQATAGVDDLVCSATATDDDNDSLDISYSWTDPAGNVVSSTDTVGAASTSEGDWLCTATVSDGTDASSSSASVAVEIGSDVDGDGFTTADGDCDDNDSTIFPGATEILDDDIDQDCDGTDATTTSQADLVAGDLRVSEMQIDPKDVTSATIYAKGEWFEIYNTTSELINLNGLEVRDYGSQSFIVSENVYIEAGGYLVLGYSDALSNNGGVAIDYAYGSSGFRFGNADAVILVSSTGTELDEVNFSIVDDSWKDGVSDTDSSKGASLSLIDFSVDLDANGTGDVLDDGRYWVESTTTCGNGSNFGTPGEANDIFDFDGDGFTSADGDCNAIDSSIYPGATDIVDDGIDQDCDGVDASAITSVNAGDLIFSEIMHAPNGNASYESWVEIYNTTSNTINLKDFVLGGAEAIEGHVIQTDILIAPNGYALFVARPSSLQNGGIVDYTDRFIYGEGAGQFRATAWTDTVVIKDSSGNVIDSVSYDASFLQRKGTSISLPVELLNATDNDSSLAWCLTTDAYGDATNFGTPGAVNSACDSTDYLALIDGDEDGFAPIDGDCDDSDPDSNTTATDADCDGFITSLDCDDNDNTIGDNIDGNGQENYYTDADGDGFGDVDATAEVSCSPISGKVTDNSDCNDTDSSTYPGAGFSENGALNTACVTDADEDGYASPTPADGATAGTDCDDIVSGAYPNGTTIEFCDFEGGSEVVDYNCNGNESNSPSRCSLSSNGDLVINGTMGETFGSGFIRQIPDISGDGIDDIVTTAHTFSNNRGKLYFYEGPISSSDPTPFMTVTGEADGNLFGFQDVSVGDVTGDGENDIIVGAHGYSSNLGRVYVVPGPFFSADVDLSIDLGPDTSTIDGNGIYGKLGWEAEVIGDVDGDGVRDLALVSQKVNGLLDGALHIITGGDSLFATGSSYLIDDVGLGATHISKAEGNQSDFAIAVIDMGDLNGDGLDDFAAVENKTDSGTYSDVHIYYGSATPSWNAFSPDVLIDMNFDYNEDGEAEYLNVKSKIISNVGDINGDGENDIAIVSPTTVYSRTDLTRGPGTVFIHTDLQDKSVRDAYLDASIVLNNPISSGVSASFGQSFASGDLNGDGVTDFLVGGKKMGAGSEGGAYLYYGPLYGEYESAQGKIDGVEAGLQVGANVEIYSSNGVTDIMLAGPIEDGVSRNAKVFVIDASSISVDSGE